MDVRSRVHVGLQHVRSRVHVGLHWFPMYDGRGFRVEVFEGLRV
jgi:hypothetical protein